MIIQISLHKMSGKYTKTDVGDVARNMIWRERIIKE